MLTGNDQLAKAVAVVQGNDSDDEWGTAQLGQSVAAGAATGGSGGPGPSVRAQHDPEDMAKVRVQIRMGLADLATAKYQVNDWMYADLKANTTEFSSDINEVQGFMNKFNTFF